MQIFKIENSKFASKVRALDRLDKPWGEPKDFGKIANYCKKIPNWFLKQLASRLDVSTRKPCLKHREEHDVNERHQKKNENVKEILS